MSFLNQSTAPRAFSPFAFFPIYFGLLKLSYSPFSYNYSQMKSDRLHIMQRKMVLSFFTLDVGDDVEYNPSFA